jgi:hypothetical protein
MKESLQVAELAPVEIVAAAIALASGISLDLDSMIDPTM